MICIQTFIEKRWSKGLIAEKGNLSMYSDLHALKTRRNIKNLVF